MPGSGAPFALSGSFNGACARSLRQALPRTPIEVAFDGMEIAL